jgi:predicted kinase
MIKVEMLVGIPGSGKSTYAKQVVSKDPANWVRINNDDLRAMMNGSVWSQDYEKMVTDARNYLIRDALKRGKNVIIDNLNINRRHFEDTCKIAKSVNVDVQVFEKAFYVEFDEAVTRNAARTGAARVPDDVMKKWFKESGGTSFKFYKPRVEIYKQNMGACNSTAEAPAHIVGAPEAIICDLDGTLALIHDRSPYDASNCDIKDLPNTPVIETVLAHYRAGRKIIFCSGREDKFKPETIRFIEKHCLIDNANDLKDRDWVPIIKPIEYQLFMRKTDDFRKDSIVKEEIYQNNIEGKYNVLLVLDDRDQVVSFWREKGLTCFQVAPGAF